MDFIDANLKVKLSTKDVVDQFLMIPIEIRLPMIERIIKMKTVRDYKYFFEHSVRNLEKSELTDIEIGILLTEVRAFEKVLNKKHDKLQKEFDK